QACHASVVLRFDASVVLRFDASVVLRFDASVVLRFDSSVPLEEESCNVEMASFRRPVQRSLFELIPCLNVCSPLQGDPGERVQAEISGPEQWPENFSAREFFGRYHFV